MLRMDTREGLPHVPCFLSNSEMLTAVFVAKATYL